MAVLMDHRVRPPYDPAIESVLLTLGPGPGRYEVEKVRQISACRIKPLTEALLADTSVRIEDRCIPGPRGELMVSIVTPATEPELHAENKLRPGIVYIHGGALISCDRFAGLDTSPVWAKELDAITVSLEYGLAPEHTGEQPVNDCYAGLLWVEANLAQLGIDPTRLILYGTSAGGGLAAATALMVRDKGGPKLAGLFLECAMLDDRNATLSAQQYTDGPFYNSTINTFAWGCLLGDRLGTDAVSKYEAPARATDLSGMPPTFMDCASAEPFRDEVTLFASKLWAAGVNAELHIWPGGPHGYDRIAPNAPIAKKSKEMRLAWMKEVFTGDI